MCDTAVAVGTATASGHVLFAKNSDRHPNESQPLFHASRRTHAPGTMLRCQYVEVPQAPVTWEVVGGRPWWLRGFETGVNEWGVAIGNEAVLSKEPFAATGLLGMDQALAEMDATVAAADALLDEAARVAEPPIVLQPAHRAALNQAAGLPDLEPATPAAVPAT